MIPIAKMDFGAEESARIAEVLSSGWVAQGPMVERFERALAEQVGCRHAIAVTSCTAGLHLLVMAMGVKPGDEVLVPAFTWIATANAVELAGGKPVFVDVDPVTFNLDPRSLGERVTSRTVGIIPVHLFGLCADMDAVRAIASKQGLWVVEDAACALGSTWRGAKAGTLGMAGCFSFHPRKSITTGEGGIITTDSDHIAGLCRSLRNHGAEAGSPGSLMLEYPRPGFNYRMTDLQAALGVAQMSRLPEFLDGRASVAAMYDRLLAEAPCTIPMAPSGCRHTYQSYVCRIKKPDRAKMLSRDRGLHRDGIISALAKDGISTRQGTHSPPFLEYYRTRYHIRFEDYPGASEVDGCSLALPIYPGMAEADMRHVAERLQFHLRNMSDLP